MNEIKPIISIIVPVYNTEQYLKQCLDSLVEQTMKNIEIICINDGSSDHSLEILNKYRQKDKRIVIINQKNTGLSGARNAGLKIVKGQYVMFIDSDDWIDIQTCKKMYASAEKENADSVMCSYIKEFADHSVINHIFLDDCVWKENEIKENFHRRLFGLINEELAKPEEGDLIVSACMQLFKYKRIDKIDFVDTEKIGTEDCLYQIMVYQNCKKFVYIDKPFYHYRKTNKASLTTAYHAILYEKWQNLYDIMQNIIIENKYNDNYKVALNNRICLSLIGLGLNEISDKNKNIFKKSKRLKQILKTDRYEVAYEKLEFKYFPFKWKIFFYLCKFKMTFLLVLMLEMIEFLRKRI